MNHNQYHRHAQAAAAQSAAWAVLCGLELAKAKKAAGRGDWELWVQANCEFDLRTAQKYMALADGLSKTAKTNLSSPTSADFQLLTQAPSALSEFDQARLMALVSKIADGATLTELYQEYGIVKKAVGGGSEGGYRPDPERVQVYLRGYHPALVGTLYADLPSEVQAGFRKWVAAGSTDGTQLALDFLTPTLNALEDPDFYEHGLKKAPLSEVLRLRDHFAAALQACDERLRADRRMAA